MDFIPVTLLITVIALAFILYRFTGARERDRVERIEWPLYAKKPLSNIEKVLYFRLVKCLPDQIVLAQVQLSRILGVKKDHNFHQWNNRINRLSADFVICEKDAKVIAVIELDDRTHERPERIVADQKKSEALTAAGIKIIRWNAGALPSEEEIKESFPIAARAGSIPNRT